MKRRYTNMIMIKEGQCLGGGTPAELTLDIVCMADGIATILKEHKDVRELLLDDDELEISLVSSLTDILEVCTKAKGIS